MKSGKEFNYWLLLGLLLELIVKLSYVQFSFNA